jgi:vacuolar-type H+-ATPase subunit B/Vma2
MKPTDYKTYASWGNELSITMTETKAYEKDKTLAQMTDTMRKSLVELAKQKSVLLIFDLDICWNVNGKYYTETIKDIKK